MVAKHKLERIGIDPTVLDVIGKTGTDFPSTGPKTPSQIKKISRDKERSVLTLDLPEQLITSLKNLSSNHATTTSQVAALLLVIGLKAVNDGKVDLDRFKTWSRSPRYDWRIRLPAIPRIGQNQKNKDVLKESSEETIKIRISVDPNDESSGDHEINGRIEEPDVETSEIIKGRR